MIQIVMIKKYNYLIGIFIIIFISTMSLWQYFKKENIYLLYNEKISGCQNIDNYEKNKYPLCNKGIYLFEKKKNKPNVLITNLEDLKLTNKRIIFKNDNYSNKNIYLVVKKDNVYEIIPVEIIQVLS